MKDPQIDGAIGVCKKAVAAFSYSWKKRRELGEVQAELGLLTHQLVTESPTRWGSRKKMIERFLEQEKSVSWGPTRKAVILCPLGKILRF